MSNKLIIMYNDGTLEYVKETKLRKKHVDKSEVDYILSPDPTRPQVYNIIKPCKLLLAARFHSFMITQLAQVDYEDNTALQLIDLPSEIDTTSVIEFIQFVTTIYRMHGFNELLNTDIPEMKYMTQVFYPVSYKTEFFDSSNRLIEVLEGKNLASADVSGIDVQVDYNFPTVYDFITEGRIDGYDDFLFDPANIMYDHKSKAIPTRIHLTGSTWKKIKKTSGLSMDADILYRIGSFGSFIRLTPGVYDAVIYDDRVSLETLSVNDYYSDQVTKKIIYGNGVLTDSEKVHLLSIMNHGVNNGIYYLYFNFNLYDGESYVEWLSYSDLIVTYMNMIVYSMMRDDDHLVKGELGLDQCCTVVHSDALDITYTSKQVLAGKLKTNLVDYLFSKERN